MRKVNLSVIRPWIVKKVVELVGFEDEVVVEYAMGLLEDDSQPVRILRRIYSRYRGPYAVVAGEDTRSAQDADQPDWLPHGLDPRIHDRPLEPPPRSSRRFVCHV